MTFPVIEKQTVIDFSIEPIGHAFIPSNIHTDFLHGNLIFIGGCASYQVVDWGWVPQKQAANIGKSVAFNLLAGCSPPLSFIDFGPTPRGSATTSARGDTHDGVYKKKKKKKQVDLLAEEVARREKLRKQIEEVIHPAELVPVEEPQVIEKSPEVRIRELKSFKTPVVDYAGLARQKIVDKLQQDALVKAIQQQELQRQEEEEEERELMMILDAIL